MAAKTKTKTEAPKTYTLEEAQTILRERKQAAREARKGRGSKRGFHADDVSEDDTTYNVLAKGEFSDGEGRLVEFRAVMSEGGNVRVCAYPCGQWVRGVSAVGPTVAEAAESLAVLLAECAEALTDNATKTVATLDRDYVRAAKSHDYNPPKRRK